MLNRCCNAIRTTTVFLTLCLFLTAATAQTPQDKAGANQPQIAPTVSLDDALLKAYEGESEAQFKVAEMYANGVGGPVDREQASYWYHQAAQQGHVLSQYNLGHHYLNGIGVQKNINTAMQWWLKAAKQNHVLAQFNVGRAYYLGIGLEEDPRSAKYWFERAAENKEPRSIAILEKMNSSNPIDTAAAASSEEQLKSVITPTEDVPESEAKPTESNQPPAKTVAAKPEAEANTSTVPATKPVERVPVDRVPVAKVPVVKTPAAEPVVNKPKIALFTNPSVRLVKIAEIEDQDNLKIVNAGGEWSQVQSISGFPVWIHGDFLSTEKNQGTVSGTSVNARANPEVSNGTVVGRFKKGERVLVVDQRNGWYQVISPPRFRAWAKSADVKKQS